MLRDETRSQEKRGDKSGREARGEWSLKHEGGALPEGSVSIVPLSQEVQRSDRG